MSWVSTDRVKGNGLKLHQVTFRSGFRKNFFAKMGIRHWNRLPREIGVIILEVFLKMLG